MIKFSEIEEDAIKEAFNIALGRAAGTFNAMVGEEIALSVPELSFALPHDALEILKIESDHEVCYVAQSFKGNIFSTDAMLIFAEDDSLELVKLFLRADMPIEEMTSMERDAMMEIGNVILNATIGSIANMIHDEIHGGLPVYLCCHAKSLFSDFSQKKQDDVLLIIYIDFKIESKQIKGYVVLVLELAAFDQFMRQLLSNLL